MTERDEAKRRFLEESGWQDIPNLLADMSADQKKTDEHRRLIAVHEYISELVKALEADFVPLNNWDNCRQQASSIQSYLPADLRQANLLFDEILINLVPFVTNSKSSAIAAGMAFAKYRDEVKQELGRLKASVDDALDELNPRLETAAENLQKTENLKSEIEKFKTELFVGSDEEESLENQIRQAGSEIIEMHNRAERYLELLLGKEQKDDG